ncbi:pentapeptide repeat-containing protein [[Leptolyngbya] sp. PCC 7376]|uniref:pentapeptide repeat-containing protein n=1 Tax=[Leptolyngbya] sp. PCC 7376 TaxID=111781 RepID=UPI0005A10BDD|nr:pentapeptide repeat-containing protein [[Leptolyngbya] sp. PCC 7376]
MKKSLFLSCFVGILAIAPVTRAENLSHLSQLFSTRSCQNCDLTATGLVNAKLGRVDLTGSDLRQANLSGADLSLANLSGADLTGASLAGANMAGANLEGAILDGADLRGTYLSGANFTNTSLNTYYVTRAVGLLEANVSAERLYQWGFIESESNNHRMAITYYNYAADIDPDNGAIYLSRAIASFKLKDYYSAQQDVTFARSLFEARGSQVGIDASDRLLAQIDLAVNPDSGSGNSFGNVVGTITSMLFRLFF